MSIPNIPSHLIMGSLSVRAINEHEVSVSQKATIGSRTVTITLILAGNKLGEHITNEMAQLAMVQNLSKISTLVTNFKLGEKTEQGETTSLTIKPGITEDDRTVVERTFTKKDATQEISVHTGKIDDIFKDFQSHLTQTSLASASVQVAHKEPQASLQETPKTEGGTIAKPATAEELARIENAANHVLRHGPIPLPPIFEEHEMPTYQSATVLTRPYLKAANDDETTDKHLEYAFVDEHRQKVILEQADRVDTIPLLFSGLETERAELEKRVKSENDPEKLRKIQQRLEGLIKRITDYRSIATPGKSHVPASWMSTNSPRMAFKELENHPGRRIALSTRSENDLVRLAWNEASSKLQISKTLSDSQLNDSIAIQQYLSENPEFSTVFNQKLSTLIDLKNDFVAAYQNTKNNFVPALINHRMQVVTDTDASGKLLSATGRSGAISDFGHGEISLQELEDYNDLVSLSENPAFPQNQPDKFNALIKRYSLESGFFNTDPFDKSKLQQLLLLLKGKALKSYGAEGLLETRDANYKKFKTENLINNSELARRLEKLSTKKVDSSLLSKLKGDLEPVELNPDKLKAIIESRKEKLSQQVLQDLFVHFKTRPASQATTIYGRTALIDMTKAGKNEYGCILHERTQGLDTSAILRDFDGATIKFDIDDDGANAGKGPYRDENGIIHMPKSCRSGHLNETTLETLCLCTSVQGNTSNSGLQKAINDEAIAKLRKIESSAVGAQTKIGSQIKQFTTSLNRFWLFRKPFRTPRVALELIHNLGGYATVNCYGGKDRTGYLLAVMTDAQLKKILVSWSGLKKGKLGKAEKALRKKWKAELVSEKGIGARVCKDNADHSVFKLTGVNLKLYTPASRVQNGVKAYKVAQKGLQFSLSSAQLYDTRFNGMPALEALFDQNAPKIDALEPALKNALGTLPQPNYLDKAITDEFLKDPAKFISKGTNNKLSYDELSLLEQILNSALNVCLQTKNPAQKMEIDEKMGQITLAIRELQRQKELLFVQKLRSASPAIRNVFSKTQQLIGENCGIPIDQRFALLLMLQLKHGKKDHFINEFKRILDLAANSKKKNVEKLKDPKATLGIQNELLFAFQKLINECIGPATGLLSNLNLFNLFLTTKIGDFVHTQLYTDTMMAALPGVDSKELSRDTKAIAVLKRLAPNLSPQDASFAERGYLKQEAYGTQVRNNWSQKLNEQRELIGVSWKGDIARLRVSGEYEENELSAFIDLNSLKLDTPEKQKAAWTMVIKICGGHSPEEPENVSIIPTEYRALMTSAGKDFWKNIDIKLENAIHGSSHPVDEAAIQNQAEVLEEYRTFVEKIFEVALPFKAEIEKGLAKVFVEDASLRSSHDSDLSIPPGDRVSEKNVEPSMRPPIKATVLS